MAARLLRRASAFTLIEMSIVLIIIATVVAGGMTIFSASLQQKEFQDTQFKLKAIQKALYNYRIANNRLPCPSDVTLAFTSQYFGYEAGSLSGSTWTADAGNCATNGTYSNDALTATAASSVAADFVNGNFVEGMVPTVALRLADDDAIDGWGRRIMYVVDKRFTAANAFSTYNVSSAGGVTAGPALTKSLPQQTLPT